MTRLQSMVLPSPLDLYPPAVLIASSSAKSFLYLYPVQKIPVEYPFLKIFPFLAYLSG